MTAAVRSKPVASLTRLGTGKPATRAFTSTIRGPCPVSFTSVWHTPWSSPRARTAATAVSCTYRRCHGSSAGAGKMCSFSANAFCPTTPLPVVPSTRISPRQATVSTLNSGPCRYSSTSTSRASRQPRLCRVCRVMLV